MSIPTAERIDALEARLAMLEEEVAALRGVRPPDSMLRGPQKVEHAPIAVIEGRVNISGGGNR